MKLSSIAFQAPQATQAQRVSNPIKSAPKMTFRTLDKELKDAMTEKELDNYMKTLDDACKQLEIEPKNLPINEEHPGNLTKDQRLQIFTLLKFDSLSELA